VKKYLAMILLIPLIAIAQSDSSKFTVSGDKVKVLINEESRKIEDRLEKHQEKKLDLYEREFELRSKIVESKVTVLEWVGIIFGALLGAGLISGIVAFIKSIRGYATRQAVKSIEDDLAKLNPKKWKIKIPRENFKNERKRLEALGYEKLLPYNEQNFKTKEGIVIFRAYSNTELQKLKNIIEDEKINSLKCFFVIYYTGKEQLDKQILYPFDSFIFSNMPATLTGHIFTASQNIVYKN